MTPNEILPRTGPGERRTLVELLGMDVHAAGGTRLGHVNDVRLTPTSGVEGLMARLVIDGLVVADRHAGSLLGYDRRADQGPRLIRWAVRALHRRAGYAPWSVVDELDFELRRVTLTVNQLSRLDHPSRS